MNYLLDVNVLVALGWSDHAEYDRVGRWVVAVKAAAGHFLTTPITQMGFVRVSVQRLAGQITPQDAGSRLKNLVSAIGQQHVFIADDEVSFTWPAWCVSASRTTDAHLLALAQAHGARLATLDTRIPGALVIP